MFSTKGNILKKLLAAIATAALVGTTLVAGSVAPATAATKLKIAHIPKLGTIGYFQAADVGVKRACKAIKATCDYKGPTEITAAAQVKEINAAVQSGYNVIILAANDKDALVRAIARDIELDSDLFGNCRIRVHSDGVPEYPVRA